MKLAIYETDPEEPPISARVVQVEDLFAIAIKHREGDETLLEYRYVTKKQAVHVLRMVGLPEED